jgi:hypothetical protein
MSFKSNKTHLKNAFNILKRQSASTSEKWKDSVQRKFYKEFINPLPKEFHSYMEELSTLEKSFEKAERTIDNLQLY